YYLPVGACAPTADASPPLLAGAKRVVYVPSATVLLTYCRRRTPSTKRSVLAVAPESKHALVTQGAARTLADAPESQALLGQAATRAAFFAAAPEYATIYFLGHALFDHVHPMWSYVELTDENLRAVDILRDLRIQADLVVLAGCETGRGAILRGDEIL